jgi:hypothetical protein
VLDRCVSRDLGMQLLPGVRPKSSPDRQADLAAANALVAQIEAARALDGSSLIHSAIIVSYWTKGKWQRPIGCGPHLFTYTAALASSRFSGREPGPAAAPEGGDGAYQTCPAAAAVSRAKASRITFAASSIWPLT